MYACIHTFYIKHTYKYIKSITTHIPSSNTYILKTHIHVYRSPKSYVNVCDDVYNRMMCMTDRKNS